MPKLLDLFGPNELSGRDLPSTQPQNLTDMTVSGSVGVSGVQYAMELASRVVPKVDYSDFSNFVFFNSALDYFNVTGDRMIAEYPYDGNFDDLLAFKSASDPYENYIIDAWPRWSGTGYFSGSVYAVVGDTAGVGGRSSLLALSTTSSLALNVPTTLEYRLLFPLSSSFPAASGAEVVFQHFSVTGTGPDYTNPNYTVYIGSGTIGFHLRGAAFTGTYAAGDRVEFPIPNAAASSVGYYVGWVLDPSGTLTLYKTNSGSSDFPFTDAFNVDGNGVPIVASWSFTTGTTQFSTGSNTLVIGKHPSAVMPAGLTASILNFQLTEFRCWAMARSSNDIYTTHNNRVYGGDPLRLYYRFAEPYYTFDRNRQAQMLLRDYSGFRMDGRVSGTTVNAFWVRADTRTGGIGMAPQDLGEPLLSTRSSNVISYVTTVQASATLYDRNNQNLITNLVPQQYLLLEDEQNTEVMKNLLYLLGRQFDELKTQIDQTVHILTADYGEFNTTPDALLDEALKFWGWTTKGNFLNKEAFQWFFGLGVLDRTAADAKQGVYSNERLEVQLYQIKNEFWRRVLNNLAYLYKTKGTRESVEALFRIYGLDQSVVKLKEYGIKPFVSIQTNRINSLKSHDVIRIDANRALNGGYGIQTQGQPLPLYAGSFGSIYTIDMQIAFPAYNSLVMPPITSSGYTGSIFHIQQSTGGGLAQFMAFPLGSDNSTGAPLVEQMYYVRETRSGTLTQMGSLIFRNNAGFTASFDNLPIFDGRWYHLSLERNSNEVRLDLQFLDTDRIGVKPASNAPLSVAIPYAASSTLSASIFSSQVDFTIGSVPETGSAMMGQFWVHNVQAWSLPLSDADRIDHTLNPFSQGVETPDQHNNLVLLWQFDKLIDSDNGKYYDSCPTQDMAGYFAGTYSGSNGAYSGLGTLGSWSALPYDRFNFSYNYIAAPDYSWTEEKIRYLDTPRPDPRDHWNEINDVGIEFNLIDALNEDIAMMMSTMDNWNNVVGDPANRFRGDYPQLEKLRTQYFRRMSGRINFRVFIDYLDFFDRSFIELIKKLLPARIDFQGAEIVVESHMLERPKVQYTYRRQPLTLVPEGTITVYGYAPLKANHFG